MYLSKFGLIFNAPPQPMITNSLTKSIINFFFLSLKLKHTRSITLSHHIQFGVHRLLIFLYPMFSTFTVFIFRSTNQILYTNENLRSVDLTTSIYFLFKRFKFSLTLTFKFS